MGHKKRLTWRKSLPSMDEELVGLITSHLRTSTAGSPSRPLPPGPSPPGPPPGQPPGPPQRRLISSEM
ncbi:unnamed protein product [Boreogadus saida]